MNFKEIISTFGSVYELCKEWENTPHILQKSGFRIYECICEDASKRGFDLPAERAINEISELTSAEFKNILDYYHLDFGCEFENGQFAEQQAKRAAVVYCALLDVECSIKSTLF